MNYVPATLTSAPVTFIVDTTAPAVTLTSTNGTARTFPFASNATVTTVGGACGVATGDVATVSIAVGGASNENGTAPCTAGAWTYTLVTPLTNNNAYTVTATQVDSAGNTGTSGAKAISVDTVAPTVTLTVVNGTARTFPLATNTTVTSVGGTCTTATGDSATVAVTITGASTQNGSATCNAGIWSFTPAVALSASGVYSITATQSDTAANVGTSGTVSITVDTTGPAITLTTVNGTARTFPLLTNTAATSVGGACGTAVGDIATVSVTVTRRRQRERYDPVHRGRVDVHVRQHARRERRVLGHRNATRHRWQHGNERREGDHDRHDRAGRHPHRRERHDPHVPLHHQRDRCDAERRLRNRVGRHRDRQRRGHRYRIAERHGNVCRGVWTYTTTPALSTNGTYSVTASQSDAAANTGTSGAQSITINLVVPVVTITTVNGTARTFPLTTNATVTTVGGTCTTAAGVNPTVSIAISGASTQNGTAACTTSAWSFTPTTALAADGVYAVTATQTDTASNVGTSGPKSITVDKTHPVVTLTAVNGTARTFPFISNVTVTTVGGTCGGSIGDSASVAVAITGASTQNGTATCSAGTFTYTPATALSADGVYSVTATQTDAAGNTGTSGAQTITVDTTAPGVTLTTENGTARTFPYTTNATATSVGGACGTAASDSTTVNIAVTGSTTQNGTAPCAAGAWTYSFSPTLSASGTYNVTATQTDTAANIGTSGVKAITIQTTAPTVTLTTVNGTGRTFPFSTNATVTTVGGACTTAAGVNATVSVSVTGASTQSGTTACTAGAWSFAPTTAFSTDGVYSVTATQSDTASNVGTSGAQAITVDKTAPVVTLTTVNGTARTFPFLTNTVVTTVGGACGVHVGRRRDGGDVGDRRRQRERRGRVCRGRVVVHLRQHARGQRCVLDHRDPDRRRGQQREQRRQDDHRRHHRTGRHAHHRQRHRPHLPVHDQRDGHHRRRRVRQRVGRPRDGHRCDHRHRDAERHRTV